MRHLEESTRLSRGANFHHVRDKKALFLALAQEKARDGRRRRHPHCSSTVIA